jgi:DNA invertase Pin-like site-specific DNA recombinase
MKVALYARVSTQGQDLDQQIAACRRFCEYKDFTIAAEFTEKVSGSKVPRPEFARLVKGLRAHEFEGVVAFRIDRLGRNSRELIFFFDEMRANGIHIFSVNENLDDSTVIGRAMIDFMCILANLERENIQEASQHRLAALKAIGKKLGRPVGKKDKKPRRRAGYLLRYAGKQARETYQKGEN